MTRESDNMSIGELEEFLRDLPMELKHLPVKVLIGDKEAYYLDPKNLTFTDGKRYYSLQILKERAAFPGMYLELYGESKNG